MKVPLGFTESKSGGSSAGAVFIAARGPYSGTQSAPWSVVAGGDKTEFTDSPNNCQERTRWRHQPGEVWLLLEVEAERPRGPSISVTSLSLAKGRPTGPAGHVAPTGCPDAHPTCPYVHGGSAGT